MSKRNWDIEVVKVITREKNQTIALAVRRKCRKQSARFNPGPALQTAGVQYQYRQTVYCAVQ
jgi:hypothetical protein